MKAQLSLIVNGETHEILVAVHKTLLEVLREDLGLTGTKHGCELGECGTCTVLVDGRPELSCLVLPIQIQGRAVTTVEGLALDGRLSPVQRSFLETGAAQCGFCIPGQLVSAHALLADVAHPTRAQVEEGLAGNLCRCAGYEQIIEAVLIAADATDGDVIADDDLAARSAMLRMLGDRAATPDADLAPQ